MAARTTATNTDESERGLLDRFKRQATYLRLSVTDRCDLRCSYCMPEDDVDRRHRSEILGFEEIAHLIRLFVASGVEAVRITGGEPLLRRDLPRLVAMLSDLPGLRDLSLTTNATRLAEQAPALRAAGLQRINISLDSLSPKRFSAITRGGDLGRVLRGIDTAVRVGFQPIKLNAVVLAGINDDEAADLVRFAGRIGAQMRFLEAMPLGAVGGANHERFVPNATTLAHLRREFDLEPVPLLPGTTAQEFRVVETGAIVGFVSPVSDRFCSTCNRLRLSCQGYLQLCLAHEDGVDLKSPLRLGATDADLRALIRTAVYRKPEGNRFEESAEPVYQISMVRIGG